MDQHTLSVLVEDKPGVLARVSLLLARRGFNIHSLAVGPTVEPGMSKMTVVVNAPELEQVKKQLHKLINVVKITELDRDFAIEREVMLVRVNASPGRRSDILGDRQHLQGDSCRRRDQLDHVSGHRHIIESERFPRADPTLRCDRSGQVRENRHAARAESSQVESGLNMTVQNTDNAGIPARKE